MKLNRTLQFAPSCLLFIVILAAPIARSGVIYDETVSGDLPVFGEPVLALAEGMNSIFGSACVGASAQGCPDSDSISFLLEPGLVVDSIMFKAFDQRLDPRNAQLGIEYWLIDTAQSPPHFFLETNFFRIAEQDFQAGFETALPLGSGLYRLAPSLTGPFISGTINRWSYEFQLKVSSVAAPSTLMLLLAGLVAVGSRRSLRCA